MKFKHVNDYKLEALRIKKRKEEELEEDTSGMMKFHMVYTVDGVKSEQDISAVNIQKAEELIRKQYGGKNVTFTSKQEVKESYDDSDVAHAIGKLRPGDKFKNRNGVEVKIIKPDKLGRVQFKIGDDVRSGSEKSIQNMLYKNKYSRLKENLKEAYNYKVSYDDLIEIQGKIDRLIRKMSDNHQDEISPSSNTYRIGLPFIGTSEGYIDLQNMNQYIEGHEDDWEEDEDDYYESLNEDVESPEKVIENEEKVPQTGEAVGLANMIIKEINGEWETISNYNDLISLMRSEGQDDMIDVISDIVDEENKHVGQLQKCLQIISPNVSEIDSGESEAKEQLDALEECEFCADDDFGPNSGFDIYLI